MYRRKAGIRILASLCPLILLWGWPWYSYNIKTEAGKITEDVVIFFCRYTRTLLQRYISIKSFVRKKLKMSKA